MEASNLIVSGLFHTLSGSFQFHRSTNMGKLALPRPTMVQVAFRDSMKFRQTRSEAALNVGRGGNFADGGKGGNFAGGGKGGNFAGGGKGGQGDSGQSRNQRMHDRFKEMLRSYPGNSLILRNYGKFLYEEEGDVKGAELCYRRAVLADPDDGEVLMLYGMLVWDHYRDKNRASAYLERAAELSPNDCMVIAAHARFLWEVDDYENEDGGSGS